MKNREFTKSQRDFLDRIASVRNFFAIMQPLEGISFFVKDENFRLIFANPYFFRRLGFKFEKDLLGKDDFELFPEPLARKFRKDDQTVMQSSNPMIGLVELFLNQQGVPAWYLTNKFPIFDSKGRGIGIMGTVQRYEKSDQNFSRDEVIESLIKKMSQEISASLSISKLAKGIGLSHRQLNRRFKSATGLTPQQFQVRKRIELACKLLRDNRYAIVDISNDLGFCDQSAFTAQFKKRMSMTPREYRIQYG